MASPADTSSSPRATRRRGAELEKALLDAAWAELQASGYQNLTMERVAERAGTSRAVIYRRWRNRGELAIAAMRHHRPVLADALPDTGSLRGDVLAVLRRAGARISEVGAGTLLGLLGDLLADDDGEFRAVTDQLTRGGTEVMEEILRRAAVRGEARPDVDPRVARLPLDLLRHELILTRRSPSTRTLEQITDLIFLPLVAA